MSIKWNKVRGWGKWGLSSIAVLAIAGSSSAFNGGPNFNGAFQAPSVGDFFDDEPCHNVPITVNEDASLGVREYGFDLAAVRDDGDPNTFVRCTHLGSGTLHEMNCIAGLSDGSFIGCDDVRSSQTMPQDGDIVYMSFIVLPDGSFEEECEILVGRTWGEPDPKCRAGGDGDGDSGGPSAFPCNSSNSTPFADNAIANANVDKCYSFNKSEGELRMSTWQGHNFVVQVGDSQGGVFSGINISSGTWVEIKGVENGPVYFYLSSTSTGSGIPIQVHDW